MRLPDEVLLELEPWKETSLADSEVTCQHCRCALQAACTPLSTAKSTGLEARRFSCSGCLLGLPEAAEATLRAPHPPPLLSDPSLLRASLYPPEAQSRRAAVGRQQKALAPSPAQHLPGRNILELKCSQHGSQAHGSHHCCSHPHTPNNIFTLM